MDTQFLILIPALALVGLSVWRARRGQAVNALSSILAFLAVVVPVGAALLVDITLITPYLLTSAALSLAGGLIVLLLERRSPQFKWSAAAGLLNLGVGGLVLLSLWTTPQVIAAVLGTPAQAASEGEMALDVTEAPRIIYTATPSPMPTLMPSFTPSPSATPLPTLTPSWTPYLFVTLAAFTPMAPTQTGSSTGQSSGASCRVSTGANLNLRQQPGTDQPILATIPNATPLTATATTADRSWWQVSYDGQTGWVTRDFLYFDAGCNQVG